LTEFSAASDLESGERNANYASGIFRLVLDMIFLIAALMALPECRLLQGEPTVRTGHRRGVGCGVCLQKGVAQKVQDAAASLVVRY
jgi:hypothetical protein